MDHHATNRDTQPLPQHRLFNNWDAVSKGWFVLCKSRALRPGQARSFLVCGHRVVAYRGESGPTYAMDAYCPHMGLDLGVGDVQGEDLRCAFHHWTFAPDGKPKGERGGGKHCLQTYQTWEGYGVVWIYPDRQADELPYLPPELAGKSVAGSLMAPQPRSCHPHSATSNGVDIHHVKAVHKVHLEIDYEVHRIRDNVIRFDFVGHLPDRTRLDRVVRFLVGPEYGYSITYVDGTLGIFNSMKNVRLFGQYLLPEAFMILAPRWTEVGKVKVYPIALTEDRPGFLGYLKTRFLLWMAKKIYSLVVAGEGDAFFRHLRYRVDNLEPGLDDPVATLVEFFDRQEISMWATPKAEDLSPQKV